MTQKNTTIGLLGSKGRMGQLVSKLLAEEFTRDATFAAQADRGGAIDSLLGVDVVIDFSTPEAMVALAQNALSASGALPAFVIGSTGWKIDDKRVIEVLAEKTPILMSSNFSTGVLALLSILRQASPLLEKLGYTPVVVETHHKHKKDAPSGTAISIQRAIAPAGPGNIQTHSVRAGEVIGDHEVAFYGSGDHITLGHFAQDRSIFARGAIEAALWLAAKKKSAALKNGLVGIETFFGENTR